MVVPVWIAYIGKTDSFSMMFKMIVNIIHTFVLQILIIPLNRNCLLVSNTSEDTLLYLLSKFRRRGLVIFIIKGFLTIVFIFIVISKMFRPICPPAFFRFLSNSGIFTEHRTTSFIKSKWVASSDSIRHNRVQVLSVVP